MLPKTNLMSHEQLIAENNILRTQLTEAKDTLRAIRSVYCLPLWCQ
jgi:hypothetical protein